MWSELPCKALLVRRGILPASLTHYDLCSNIVEDINHVLLECPYSQDCWIYQQDQIYLEMLPISLSSLVDLVSTPGMEKRK